MEVLFHALDTFHIPVPDVQAETLLLSDVELFFNLSRHVVLDEADQMLERGFADSVEEIMAASFKGTGLQGELLWPRFIATSIPAYGVMRKALVELG